MSDLLEAFRHRHQERLAQLESGEDEEALLDGVRILIADLRQAGASVAGQAGRGRLRALVRFWAGGGIVQDSVLGEEYQETFDKAAAMLRLLSAPTSTGDVQDVGS